VQSNGKVILSQKLPEILGVFSYGDICELIGLDEHELGKTQLPIEAVSTGLSDLILPVPSGSLDVIEPNHPKIIEFCQKHDLIGLHIFELCPPGAMFFARCRNFAPLVGIPEESATGSSSGALACYLSKHVAPREEYLFEQGKAMKCTSHIHAYVQYDSGSLSSIAVGGIARLTGCREVVVSKSLGG
jgi:PhzF family phenazine biosynthesis protein